MESTLTAPVDASPGFHALAVLAIEQLGDDAAAVTLVVPEGLRTAYAWSPGQHVAVRVPGDDLRRSYSLCPAADGALRIGIRRLPGGRFSGEVLDRLAPGDRIEVMTPAGRFGAALPGLVRPAFVAGGSGITPVLAMAAAALADPGVERVSLVLVNRSQAGVMFLDEMADLKDAHPDRLQLVHVLTRESQASPLLSGRLDAERFGEVRERLLPDGVDGWFLCGPQGLVVGVRDALLADDVPAPIVHTELFHADVPDAPPVAVDDHGTLARVRLGGRSGEVLVRPGEALLDAVLRIRRDAPYACKGGVCGTCRARVTSGEVVLAASWALEPEELDRGYVLTCQARATSDEVELDYDA